MENRKQLFADCADAPQRRGLHHGGGVDCSPVRQLSLASPPLHILGTTVPCYIALASLLVNIVISAVLSLVLNAVSSDRHRDVTVRGQH